MKQFFLVLVLCLPTFAFAQAETQSEAQLQEARSRAAERAETYLETLQRASNTDAPEVQAAQEELLAAQTTVARLSDARATYTVRPGDSLSSIAVDFYQDGYCWPFVMDANTYLEDPDAIFPGLVLVIPTL